MTICDQPLAIARFAKTTSSNEGAEHQQSVGCLFLEERLASDHNGKAVPSLVGTDTFKVAVALVLKRYILNALELPSAKVVKVYIAHRLGATATEIAKADAVNTAKAATAVVG